jgi:formylmethanofuran dehydrogenase subunit E
MRDMDYRQCDGCGEEIRYYDLAKINGQYICWQCEKEEEELRGVDEYWEEQERNQ